MKNLKVDELYFNNNNIKMCLRNFKNKLKTTKVLSAKRTRRLAQCNLCMG